MLNDTMRISSNRTSIGKRLGQVCSILAGGLAVLVLWSWIAGVSDLFTSSPQHIPMAPSTALLLAAAGTAVFLRSRWPNHAGVQRFGYGVVGLMSLIGLLVCLRHRVGWNSPLEHWLAQTTDRIRGIQVGEMSPLTGVAFVVTGMAFLVQLSSPGGLPLERWFSVILALAVLLASTAVAMSYGADQPWLYNSSAIPMALWTAIGFVLLNLALLGTASIRGSESIPSQNGARLMPLAVFGLLALGVSLLGAIYLRDEQVQLRENAWDLLRTVGNLKLAQLVNWRHERLSNGQFFARAPFFARDVEALLGGPPSERARSELLQYFRLLKTGSRYESVALFDTNSVLRLCEAGGTNEPPFISSDFLEAVSRTNQVILSDLYRDPQSYRIHMDVILPVFAVLPASADGVGSAPRASSVQGRRLGTVLARIDARRFLYPLIQSWPIPSSTAETLLLRREGNEMLYLNDVRHMSHTALRLRRPIKSEEDSPAFKALMGRTGQVEGADYRGVPVLAVVRPVPSSPWYMVTKIDRSEIYGSLREQAWLTLALTMVLAGATGLVVRLVLKHREAAHAKLELNLERRRRALAERLIAERKAKEHEIRRLNRLYAVLSQVNQAIVRAHSRNEMLDAVCGVAVEHGGFQLVWVGYVEPADWSVTPVARAGSAQGLVARFQGLSGNHPDAHFLLDSVLREGRPHIVGFSTGTQPEPPCLQTARELGLAGCASFPLHCDGVIWGILSFCTSEPDFFNDAEVNLLGEVAMDISYALEYFKQKEDQRRAEEAVEQRERHLRTILRTTLDGFALLDMSGGFVEVNNAYCAMSGYSRGELLRMRIQEVENLMFETRSGAHLKRISRQGTDRFETQHRRKDGRVIDIEVSANMLDIGDGRFACFFRDITERKRLETQLRQAQKMEAIGQLAGGVAHDFNNILTAFMMQLSLLQRNRDLSPAMGESLRDLEAGAKQAASLTRQLLMFSRRSVMQPQILDLNQVVENLLKMLRRLIGEHIQLDWKGKAPLPPIKADLGMLEQVVMNLVVNARDAMPNGGRLGIATDSIGIDDKQARENPEARPGTFVCLEVNDTGCGMSEEVLKRLFEPFFTTKEAGKGTGLGLATVYGITKQHQGWIAVESKLGQGSVFRVFLPTAAKAPQTAPPGPLPRPVQGGHETILLVEDDQAVRRTVESYLQGLGYRVLVADNGIEAITRWQQQGGEVQLLFTDMVMPEGITGLELAKRLRVLNPNLKVIIFSGYSAELTHQNRVISDGIGYLPKPCSPKELALTIRRVLDTPE
ncbi:MAG: response regulator [Candidatus Omnitrophica bacterium]|nr:response regulator [Candidatus Omnitrophota bacterium]